MSAQFQLSLAAKRAEVVEICEYQGSICPQVLPGMGELQVEWGQVGVDYSGGLLVVVEFACESQLKKVDHVSGYQLK